MWLGGKVRPGSDAIGWYDSCYASIRSLSQRPLPHYGAPAATAENVDGRVAGGLRSLPLQAALAVRASTNELVWRRSVEQARKRLGALYRVPKRWPEPDWSLS